MTESAQLTLSVVSRQTLFGAVFVSVGENVLDSQLIKRLAGFPGIAPAALIKHSGVTEILNDIPIGYRAAALVAYNDSLRAVFQVAVCMACLAILGAVCMEWRTVKKGCPPKSAGGQQAAEEGKSTVHLPEKDDQPFNSDADKGRDAAVVSGVEQTPSPKDATVE